jgi:hypothetical protein
MENKNSAQELIMEKSLLDQIEICANIFSKVAVPLILLVLGLCLNSSYKEKELQLKYVEIAVGILGSQPSPDTLPLRTWAIKTVNNHAEIKMTTEVKRILKEKPLPKPQPAENVTKIESKKEVESAK